MATCACVPLYLHCELGALCVQLDTCVFLFLSSCWTRNSNMNYWLIIRLPILFAIGVSDGVGMGVAVLAGQVLLGEGLETGRCFEGASSHSLPSALQVNFLIFVRVICIVVSKLKANLMCKTDIKCR